MPALEEKRQLEIFNTLYLPLWTYIIKINLQVIYPS